MKIWVVGAEGMLGSSLCRLLVQRLIPFIKTGRNIDITQEKELDLFFRSNQPTHIINCAAYTQVDRAEEEQNLSYAVNAVGPKNLSAVAQRYGAHLTHISTDYVFDGKSQFPYDEESVCSPLGVYGLTKREGELYVLESCAEACIIRTSWLFGLERKSFVKTILQLMHEREVLKVVSDQFGSPTYCDDLSEAIIALLGQKGIFHFANRGVTSWYLFALKIAEKARKYEYPIKCLRIDPVCSSQYVTVAKRPLYSVLNTQKIEKIMPAIRTWEDVLEDYMALTSVHCPEFKSASIS